MCEKTLKFIIFGNSYQAKKSSYVEKVINTLRSYKAEITIEEEFYIFITQQLALDLKGINVLDAEPDFLPDFAISMGGDGTFLKAAERVGKLNIPILGINTGHLGFLAAIKPEDIDDAFDAIFSENYTIEMRSIIQVESESTPLTIRPYALNEVAVLKHDNSSTIKIHTQVNGEDLTTYISDGLILSTPTGSTGYALSVNGPILAPDTGVFLLVAVAPHSLSIRPIVLRDDVEITMSIESRNHNYLVAIDGQNQSLSEGTILRLRKAKYLIRMVKMPKDSYFNTLRKKLMWGADQRT